MAEGNVIFADAIVKIGKVVEISSATNPFGPSSWIFTIKLVNGDDFRFECDTKDEAVNQWHYVLELAQER